jgi:pilus assembly protein Flp/PilA
VKTLFLSLYCALSSTLSRLRREEGQTMAEYGILIAVIAIVVVAAAVLLGGKITNLFNNTASSL